MEHIMKKYRYTVIGSWSLIVCAVLMLFGSSAAAQAPNSPIRIGLGGGLNLPFKETGDWLDLSPSLHGTLLGQAPNSPLKFEGDLGYWFLQLDDKKDKDSDNPSLLTLTGGIRYYLTPQFHFDGGLGLYRFSDWDKADDDERNKLGFYGGAGFEHSMFDVTIRIHHSDFYDVEDFWNVGASFRIFLM
jgi:hypothetical protein